MQILTKRKTKQFRAFIDTTEFNRLAKKHGEPWLTVKNIIQRGLVKTFKKEIPAKNMDLKEEPKIAIGFKIDKVLYKKFDKTRERAERENYGLFAINAIKYGLKKTKKEIKEKIENFSL